MTTRRLGAAAIIVACLASLGGALSACSSGEESFEPSAEGYLELACSIRDYQRDLSLREISDSATEEQLAYAASTALLESGNRELDTKLQDLSDDLKVAIDEDDGQAFDDARSRLDDKCEADDLLVEPDHLDDIACSIADVLEPGPGPEVLLVAELLNSLASGDDDYDDLAAASGRLVINPDDPMDSGHPDEAAIAAFQKKCD